MPKVEDTPEIEITVPSVSHLPEVCICIKIILKGLICLKGLSYALGMVQEIPAFILFFTYSPWQLKGQKSDMCNIYLSTDAGRYHIDVSIKVFMEKSF